MKLKEYDEKIKVFNKKKVEKIFLKGNEYLETCLLKNKKYNFNLKP